MVAARRPLVLLLSLITLLIAGSAFADVKEDLNVARSRMNASAEKLRRSDVRLTDDQKSRRRELITQAQGLHDESKSLSPGDDAGAGRLVQEMDATRDEIDELLATLSEPAASAAATGDFSSGDAGGEPAGPAASPEPIPEEPPKPVSSGVAVAQYRDMVRDVIEVRERLVPDEFARVRELMLEGDAIAAAIEANPHEDHVARAAHAADLSAVTHELLDLHVLALSDRRVGIPFVEARSTATGWSNVGVEQGPFHVLRARFIKPGSAYVTVRNASDTERPFAISLDFTDVAGQPTGNAAHVSPPDASLRAGEVREVLLGIAPSIDHFWTHTTDFSVSVR